MVDFNALIVWKTLIDICFSIKSSLWALTAAYTKFRKMIWSMIWSCGHRSRPPMCTVTSSKRRETSLGKSWKHTTLWFLGGSSHYRCLSAILVTTAMTQPPPLLSAILPPTSAPPPFNESLGYHNGKIVELKTFVGWVLEHFDGLMRLIIFPWNKKVISPAKFPYLLCRTIFPCCILRRRGCLWTPLVAVYQKANPAYPGFYNGWVHVVGTWPGDLEDLSIPPMGSRDKAPVVVLGTVHQKLKNNVKLVYNF